MAVGNYVGPYSTFAVECNYGSYQDNGNGTYTATFNCKILVNAGTNGFQGTQVSTNWSAGTVSMYKSDCGEGTATVTVNYGQTANFTAVASYTGSTTYTSSATASYTYAPTYTVTYNSVGGDLSPETQTKIYGVDLTLSRDVPIYPGYHFCGWSTLYPSTSAQYQPGDTYKENKSIILFAVWLANTYYFDLRPNNGTVENSVIDLLYGETFFSSLDSSFIPVRSGYKFSGWFTAPEGGTRVYDASGHCTNDGTYFSSDFCIYIGENGEHIHLYAHWESANVAYYYNDGSYILCNTYGKINGLWEPRLLYGKINGQYKQSVIGNLHISSQSSGTEDA